MVKVANLKILNLVNIMEIQSLKRCKLRDIFFNYQALNGVPLLVF